MNSVPDFEIELKLLQQRSQQRIALSFALVEFRFRLSWLAVNRRINEQEAVVHAKHFDQYFQPLFGKYGYRRTGNTFDEQIPGRSNLEPEFVMNNRESQAKYRHLLDNL